MLGEYGPVFRRDNFLYLWISQILSQLTINIMNFVLLFRLFEKTGSTIATSFLWVAYALPAIFIGPFASATVDMVDRRKMLVATNFLQSCTIFLYALSHRTSFFLLYGTVLAYSFLNQFYVPAEAAALPSVLSKKMLPQGNSLFFLTQQAALVVGLGVAGFLNQLLGFDRTLYLCASFVFIAFLSVTFLPKLTAPETIPTGFESALVKFFERIGEGYKFIKSQRTVYAPLILLTGLQIGLAIIVVNLPMIARDILEVDLNSVGIFVVVPATVGAALGAILTPKLIGRGWRKKRMIETSLSVMTFLFFFLTFVLSQASLVLRPFLGTFAVLFLGLSFVGVVVPAQTFLQEVTPGGLRGRVFGSFWFLSTIATIFPTIFSATIAELFGVRLLLFLLAAIAFGGLAFSQKYGYKFVTSNSR